jgi:hypothetical protein
MTWYRQRKISLDAVMKLYTLETRNRKGTARAFDLLPLASSIRHIQSLRNMRGSLPVLLLLVVGCRGTLKPQISLPPCTEAFCFKPCGCHHVESLGYNFSCYHSHGFRLLNGTVYMLLDIFVRDLIGKATNITVIVEKGHSVSLSGYLESYCDYEERNNRHTCPIPAHSKAWLIQVKSVLYNTGSINCAALISLSNVFIVEDIRLFLGTQASARLTIEDENGRQLCCFFGKVRVEDFLSKHCK